MAFVSFLKLSHYNLIFYSAKVNLSASKSRAVASKPEKKPEIEPPPPPPQQQEEAYEEEEEEEEEEIQSVGNLLNSFHADGGYGGDYDEY